VHEISLEFRDLQDISLQDTLGLEVVYVLWGPHAKKGPSLISQGKLLEALANPDNAYRGKVRGIFSTVEGNERTRRRDTDLVESALIAAAKSIGASPARNLERGSQDRLTEVGPRRGEFRIGISGHDPFATNSRSREEEHHWIEMDFAALHRGDDEWLRHNWRRRN
jgi:hypothetical protein